LLVNVFRAEEPKITNKNSRDKKKAHIMETVGFKGLADWTTYSAL